MQTTNAVIALFGPLGWPEITVIIIVFILLFGAKKLPELARGVGKSIKEFKKATSNIEDEVRSAIEEEPNKPSAPKPTATQKETEKTTS